jgi:zinc/manganese transport system substrate-binding protein
VAEISEADLIVANGLDLEEGLEDVLSQAASEGLNVLEVGDGVDPRVINPLATSHDDDGAESGEHGAFDPHFWQDPIRMKTAVDLIATALTGAGSPDAAANAIEYLAEIDATDAQIIRLLEPIPDDRRLLVTNHDAFEYFAERYGFDVIGTIIPGGSTLAEPSSAEMAALVETIISNQVPAIFVENTVSPALAEILAEETGTEVEVVQLTSDSLGEPGSATGTYLEMLIANATAIAEALS